MLVIQIQLMKSTGSLKRVCFTKLVSLILSIAQVLKETLLVKVVTLTYQGLVVLTD